MIPMWFTHIPFFPSFQCDTVSTNSAAQETFSVQAVDTTAIEYERRDKLDSLGDRNGSMMGGLRTA